MGVIGPSPISDDDVHCSRGFQAMEKDLHGNVCGASTSHGEMETSTCRTHFPAILLINHARMTCLQYVHGLAARGVHYLHQPGPTLQDLGFMLLPWTFHPFVYHSKRLYTVLIWLRVLAFLVACQILRIITFYSTQLPGPNYHCREGSKLARLPPPETIAEVLLINFPRGVLFGCGDLIFSSHMIFTLVFVLAYHKYGSKRFMKFVAWLVAVIQSLLIVASRKHYTVDVVVAWYTVTLVVFFVDKKLPEMPERSSAQPLLPLSAKEKDEKSREEHRKLLNGNIGDTADRRQRLQMNGKHGENTNHIHSEPLAEGA